MIVLYSALGVALLVGFWIWTSRQTNKGRKP